MANAQVTVTQLTSQSKYSFFNVGDEQGRVEVSGVVYNHPTILCRNGIHFTLIQFDSEAWMKEWLDENAHKWDVTVLREERKIDRKD